MVAPPEVVELVETFHSHHKAYQSEHYKETQLRHEFIDKFFMALGWDVNNVQGYAEAYKDVIHEDAIKVGGITKAPDYCFRIVGARKFFVEAKKPSTHIKDDTSAAFQLRRYAWSAKLPLSILTDFEEFAVYDCREKPSLTDKASVGRTLLVHYKDYADRWDEIASVFSLQSILKGSFDKYVESNRAKRGTAEVDAAFLEEIEAWRKSLAQNIALRNPMLRSRELNASVQQIINRIVFLRICEARGMESYGLLLGLINGPHIYDRLTQLFLRAEEKYDSGLFHFHQEKGYAELPDGLTLGLSVDDKPLKELIKNLYYPDSPYEFSVLPADILGQVYERFLGKVIRLTPKHLAVVEDKPEVKKAGGVFYTPSYIVDYIVSNTLGKLTKGKKPKEVDRLKIADIACGSGSFLIVAYQFLLDWYRDVYVKEGTEKHKKELHRTAAGDWRLTPSERKRILLNNIYGADIDAQAVEVTKLSLLLKVLEGETGETLATQLQFFQERALPNLGNNIKCGNSLIDSAFYENAQMSFLGEDDRYRINIFDWKCEFPGVFNRGDGGFDVVIGNPPYIRIQALKEWAPVEVEYYKEKFKAASKGNYDIYTVFLEQGLSLLNSQGVLGYILPHKFFNAQYGEPLRELITQGKHLRHIVHFGDEQVFSGATTYTCLLFLDKCGNDQFDYIRADDLLDWRTLGKATEGTVTAANSGSAEWNFAIGGKAELLDKLKRMPVKLGDVTHSFVGTQTSADDVFVLDNCRRKGEYVVGFSHSLDREVEVEAACTKPFLRGRQIRRYQPLMSDSALISPYHISQDGSRLLTESEMVLQFPLAFAYLRLNKSKLAERERGRFRNESWYAFGYPKSMMLFQKPKIVVPDYNNSPSFTFDHNGHFFKTGYGILIGDGTLSPLFILGLLNSPLLFQHLLSIGTSLRGGYVRFWTQYIERLPIKTLDLADKGDRAKHDRMVGLVKQMLSLNQELQASNTPQEKTALQRQIDALDRLIDGLVYELYGLSDDEIKIVEEGNISGK